MANKPLVKEVSSSLNMPLLRVDPHAKPNMSVHINSGNYEINGMFHDVATQNSDDLVAPSSNPQWWAVVVDDSNSVDLVEGAENATPVFPEVADNQLVIAGVKLEVGQTAITAADIYDMRPLVVKNKVVKLQVFTTVDRNALTLAAGDAGLSLFDSDLGLPILWNGAAFIDAAGNVV